VTAKQIARFDLAAGEAPPDDGMGREQAKISVGTGSAKGLLNMDRICLDSSESVCVMSGLIEATEMTELKTSAACLGSGHLLPRDASAARRGHFRARFRTWAAHPLPPRVRRELKPLRG